MEGFKSRRLALYVAKLSSRVDCACDAVRHPSAIERNAREPSPDVEYPDGGCWVGLSASQYSRAAGQYPRFLGAIGGRRGGARRGGLRAHEPSDPAEPVGGAGSEMLQIGGDPRPWQRLRCAVRTTQNLPTPHYLMDKPEDVHPINGGRAASELRPILRVRRISQRQEMHSHPGTVSPLHRGILAGQRLHG
jgi:hypothetical protein